MVRILPMVFWVSLVAAMAVYGVMLLWTLPAISQAAGGLMPFDMRPGGYTFAEAQAFLAALTPEGRHLYLTAQHRLDTAYPLLLAVALGSGLVWLAPAVLGRARWLLAILPVPGALFDYLENLMVGGMLRLDGIDSEGVGAASLFTLLKSAFTGLAMTVFLALAVYAAVRRWRGRHRHRQA